VNVASSEHDRLHGEIAETKKKVKAFGHNNMIKICEDMDTDGSGDLSADELLGFKHSEAFCKAIADLDLTQEEVTIAFSTMDEDHSGTVSYKEFVHKLYKMKDSDAMNMMEQIKYLVHEVRDGVVKMMEDNQKELVEFEKNEAAALEKLVGGEEKLEKLLIQNMSADGVNQAADNEPDDVKQATPNQEKETKQMLMGWPGMAEVVPTDSEAGRLDLQIAAGGPQLSKDVMDSLLQAFSHFQVDFKDFRDSLKHLESSLEVHTSTTSNALTRLVSPEARGDDLVAVPSSSTAVLPVSSRSNGTRVCCGGSVLPSPPVPGSRS